MFEQIADIFTNEQVTITGNKGTIAGTVEAYEEYSVIILYKGKQSDIISCDNGYDANIYYTYLSRQWDEFKANEDKKQSAAEDTFE